MQAVQENKGNNYEETIEVISKDVDTSGELPKSVKEDNAYEEKI